MNFIMRSSALAMTIATGFLLQVDAATVIGVTIQSACPYAVSLSWIGSATKGFNVYRAATILGTKAFIGSVNGVTKSATDITYR